VTQLRVPLHELAHELRDELDTSEEEGGEGDWPEEEGGWEAQREEEQRVRRLPRPDTVLAACLPAGSALRSLSIEGKGWRGEGGRALGVLQPSSAQGQQRLRGVQEVQLKVGGASCTVPGACVVVGTACARPPARTTGAE